MVPCLVLALYPSSTLSLRTLVHPMEWVDKFPAQILFVLPLPVIKEILYIFDQVRPMVSHLEVRLP